MSIKIKRHTGLMSQLPKFSVFINGQKVKELKNGEITKLEIPGNKATIQASQLGIKTNELIIENGEELKITTTKIAWYSLLIIAAIVFILSFIPNNVIKFLGMVVTFIVYLIYFYLTKGTHYRIENS